MDVEELSKGKVVVELSLSEDTSDWFGVLGSLDILAAGKAVNGDESQDV